MCRIGRFGLVVSLSWGGGVAGAGLGDDAVMSQQADTKSTRPWLVHPQHHNDDFAIPQKRLP